jgi:hypothetical protein
MLHRLLAGCLLLLAGSAIHAAPPPQGLDVRLEPQDGRTTFVLGEPIVLDLLLSARTPGFQVNVLKSGVGHQIDVSPAEGWFRSHGVDHHDTVMFKPLTEAPLRSPVLLNSSIVFRKPGHYEVSVTTDVEHKDATPGWLKVTTNTVVLEITAPDEAAESARVETLVAKIAAQKKCRAEEHAAARELSFLGGAAATRAKVAFIVGAGRICESAESQMMEGLASSRELPLQLSLLHDAWLDASTPPSFDVLRALRETRGFLHGEMVEGWQMILRKRTDPAALRAAQEAGQDIDEQIATLPRRKDKNRAFTAYLLMELDDLTDGQIASVRPYVIETFGRMSPLQQSMLLVNRHWPELADPAVIPALKFSLDHPRTDGLGDSDILRGLIGLSPDAARPYVVNQICDPASRADGSKLVGLPDEALPEVDACLTAMLAQWHGDRFLRTVKGALLARYASAAALPAVRELYAHRPADGDYFSDQYEGALLGYLLRYAPDEAMADIQARSGNLDMLLYPIANAFGDRHADFPPAYQAWLKQRMAQAASATGSSAGTGLR